MPPHWIGVHLAISNKDGHFPEREIDVFNHFCSTECLIEYLRSQEFRERRLTVDAAEEEGEEEDDE